MTDGGFSWVGLLTSDIERATSFYGELSRMGGRGGRQRRLRGLPARRRGRGARLRPRGRAALAVGAARPPGTAPHRRDRDVLLERAGDSRHRARQEVLRGTVRLAGR